MPSLSGIRFVEDDAAMGEGRGKRDLASRPAGRPNRAVRSLFWLDRAGRRDSEYIAFLSLSLSFAPSVPISLDVSRYELILSAIGE